MSQPAQTYKEAPMTIRERFDSYSGPPQLMLKAAYCTKLPVITLSFMWLTYWSRSLRDTSYLANLTDNRHFEI
jgi:hypothetical protein